jgi:LPXTG-motif cell wall-anchored protein
MVLLTAENSMYQTGGSEIFILLIVGLIFGLGIYTLLKFRKNKNF